MGLEKELEGSKRAGPSSAFLPTSFQAIPLLADLLRWTVRLLQFW